MEWKVRKLLVYVLVPTILSGLFASSCGRVVPAELMEIETYIDESPAKALSALDSIPSERLKSSEVRAKYALLKSMVLDKNYVDVLSDSIISPAVKYYARHGSADDKLKTCYYRGLIPYYSGDYDDAMEWFVKAARYTDKASDSRAVALVYFKIYEIYNFLFDRTKAFDTILIAAEKFREAGDIPNYIESLDNAERLCLIRKNYDAADSLLSKMWEYRDELDESQLSDIYASSLQLSIGRGVLDREVLQEYLSVIRDSSVIDWLTVAESYNSLGDYTKARSALIKYGAASESEDGSAAYNSLLSHASYKLGDFKTAYEAYSRYVEISDERDMKALKSEAKFAEERLRTDMELHKHQTDKVILILSLTVISLLLIVVYLILTIRVQKIRKNKEAIENENVSLHIQAKELEAMVEEAKEEIDRIKSLKKRIVLDKKTVGFVDERLSLLNKCVMANLSNNLRLSAMDDLRELLADRKRFIESTRASLLVAHKEFISALKKSGLDEDEINYCCLYAMGMNSQDLADFLSISNRMVYKKNSEIREKFHLQSKDSSLPDYISRLLNDKTDKG